MMVCALLAMRSGVASAESIRYEITILGDLPGGTYDASPGAISNSGEVAGRSSTATGTHGFFWDGTMHDLGYLPGYPENTPSYAYGLNDNGVVVGRSDVNTSGIKTVPFRWDAVNGMQELGMRTGQDEGSATAINNLGQIVGRTMKNSSNSRATLWDADGTWREILSGQSGISSSNAADINDQGQVVGNIAVSALSAWHAFVWDSTHGMLDLGLPYDTQWSEARAISETGIVAGSVKTDDGWRATIWQETAAGWQATSLGVFNGGTYSYAYDVNSQGQVIGSGSNGAFIWDATNGMRRMNDLIDGWYIYSPAGINDQGQIAALAWDEVNGGYHAILATPHLDSGPSAVPEPSTLIALAGMACIALLRLRPLANRRANHAGRVRSV